MTTNKSDLDAILRNDLQGFIEKTFHTVVPGQTYLPNWHIDVVAYHLMLCARGGIKRLAITLPPRHLKSICASVAYPAWLLGQDPTNRIISVSYSSELAGKHMLDFRSVLESPWYRGLFPKTRIHWRKNTEGEVMTTKHGFRLSTSVGGTLTGRGGNFIIIDDPIKPTDATSQAELKRVNEWYDNTLYSRLDNKNDDVIILVMQRVHVDDLVAHVLEHGDWFHLNLPAIATEEQRLMIGYGQDLVRPRRDVLHPGLENRQTLADIKVTIGSYNFASQYQQNPVPPEGNLINWNWFQIYDERPSQFDEIIQSWDTASKAEEINDYSVCTTWGIKGNDYYLLDVFRGRFNYPSLKQRVVTLYQNHRANAILIEDAGSGIPLIQDLRCEGSVRPIAFKPKGDKVTRASAASAKIEAGHVLIPKTAPWLDDLMTEVLAFPHGRHDDQVDSMTQFLNWITYGRRQRTKLRGYGVGAPRGNVINRYFPRNSGW
jgi:predicted phage terminase large subunit-like protein